MHTRLWVRALAPALALSLSAACATWQVQEATPEVLLATKKPEIIQITRLDSTQIELRLPRLIGDTIVGARNGRYERVAVADVLGVSVREGGGAGPAVAVAAGMGLLIVVLSTDISPDFSRMDLGHEE